MKIVYMGTGDFGLPALDRLADDGHEVALVVSRPARPKGRGLKLYDSQVVTYANAHDWPVVTPEKLKDPALAERLKSLEADLFVVAAFRILPPEIFTIPRLGTVNIHASLLPAYRGPAPIQRAIQAGETRTGVTIFAIDEGIDTGGVILQKQTDIGPQETSVELYERLQQLGADALGEAVTMLGSGSVDYVVQDESQASAAPKLSKHEGLVDWEESSNIIFNKIRAFKPFPGTYTMSDGKRLGIEWATPLEDENGGEPGTVCALERDAFVVQCGQGCLRVTEVKPEGKRAMDGASFMRGARTAEGTRLG